MVQRGKNELEYMWSCSSHRCQLGMAFKAKGSLSNTFRWIYRSEIFVQKHLKSTICHPLFLTEMAVSLQSERGLIKGNRLARGNRSCKII